MPVAGMRLGRYRLRLSLRRLPFRGVARMDAEPQAQAQTQKEQESGPGAHTVRRIA